MTQESAGVDRLTRGGRPGGVHDVGATHARREGKAAGEGFAQADQVGYDAAVLTGKPFPGAAKPGENLVQDQQGAVFVALPPQEGEKFWRREIDATARLDGFDQHGAWLLLRKQAADFRLGSGELIRVGGKRGEVSELAELRAERPAEMFAVRGVERSVAETVVSAFKGDDSAFSCGQHGRLERGLDRFKAGIAKNGLRGGAPDFEP